MNNIGIAKYFLFKTNIFIVCVGILNLVLDKIKDS